MDVISKTKTKWRPVALDTVVCKLKTVIFSLIFSHEPAHLQLLLSYSLMAACTL